MIFLKFPQQLWRDKRNCDLIGWTYYYGYCKTNRPRLEALLILIISLRYVQKTVKIASSLTEIGIFGARIPII